MARKAAGETTPKSKEEVQAEKAARFVRLATKRTQKALKTVRLIANLAAPNYIYTQEQVDKILGALANEVKAVQNAFAAPKGGKEEDSFTI